MSSVNKVLALVLVVGGIGASAEAGSVFVTGHDPDFHALLGGNAVGAQHINQRAINFIMDPAANPFVAGGATKFLFVESSISPPGGHVNGVGGIVASGYANGVAFDHVNASGLNAALNQLGTTYGGIVVASDFGGVLTQAELNILNTRAGDILSFVNAGGGLYAMAEGNSGAGLTPNGGWFGYLPFLATSAALNQSETGFSVSAFGASLGLTAGDINGNASHNVFTATGGMNPVDFDSQGNIMSLAYRGQLNGGGVVPLPSASMLALTGMAGVAIRRRRR